MFFNYWPLNATVCCFSSRRVACIEFRVGLGYATLWRGGGGLARPGGRANPPGLPHYLSFTRTADRTSGKSAFSGAMFDHVTLRHDSAPSQDGCLNASPLPGSICLSVCLSVRRYLRHFIVRWPTKPIDLFSTHRPIKTRYASAQIVKIDR